MVKSKSRSRPQRNFSVEVELLMECVDEELSPIQKSTYKKAVQEYNAVKKQMEQYKANNAIIEVLKVPLTPAEILELESKPVVTVEEFISGAETTFVPVPTPQTFQQVSKKSTTKPQAGPPVPALSPVATPSLRPQRKAAQAAKSLITIDDEEDDVIIVGNEVDDTQKNRGAAKSHGKGQVPTTHVHVLSAALSSALSSQQPYPVLNQVAEITNVSMLPGALYQSPVQSQVVSGTFGLGIKRGAGNPNEMAPPMKKKPTKKAEDDQMIQVPLDEYYYSKKEGDPAYREEKGEYRFKCWYCHKMLYNNMRIMMHMQGHIDSEKQQNLDLSDLTQCKHCFKQFDTPFEMQCHIEKVHQNKFNVLVCRICEKDHDNQTALRQHMKASHNACEMPYVCQLCNFRSSIYSDVVDHFKKRHDSSQYVMCLYCLKVFKIAFSKTSGWGLTQNFYQHIQKHQTKGNNKKCNCCKLTFINKVDVKMHRQRDHLPNFRGAISGTAAARTVSTDNTEQVMIKLPSDGKGGKLKSLNAPIVSKVQEIRGVRFNWVTDTHMCKECKLPMNSLDHFRKYVECSLCRYATTCSNAYALHMMDFHSGSLDSKRRGVSMEKTLGKKWFCLCGYSTSRGNSLANHLVICSKRTGYLNPPAQKYFEYDDEQEEFNPFEPYNDESEIHENSSPEKEIPSLFGALGLVRKQDHPGITKKARRRTSCCILCGPPKKKFKSVKDTPSPSREEMSPQQIADNVVSDVLDHMFPGETEAGRVVKHVMKKVTKKIKMHEKEKAEAKKQIEFTPVGEDIPPELTGAQKWSTVKIADSKEPTKASVFLGSEDDKQKEDKEAAALSKETTIDAQNNKETETSKEETLDTEAMEVEETAEKDALKACDDFTEEREKEENTMEVEQSTENINKADNSVASEDQLSVTASELAERTLEVPKESVADGMETKSLEEDSNETSGFQATGEATAMDTEEKSQSSFNLQSANSSMQDEVNLLPEEGGHATLDPVQEEDKANIAAQEGKAKDEDKTSDISIQQHSEIESDLSKEKEDEAEKESETIIDDTKVPAEDVESSDMEKESETVVDDGNKSDEVMAIQPPSSDQAIDRQVDEESETVVGVDSNPDDVMAIQPPSTDQGIEQQVIEASETLVGDVTKPDEEMKNQPQSTDQGIEEHVDEENIETIQETSDELEDKPTKESTEKVTNEAVEGVEEMKGEEKQDEKDQTAKKEESTEKQSQNEEESKSEEKKAGKSDSEDKRSEKAGKKTEEKKKDAEKTSSSSEYQRRGSHNEQSSSSSNEKSKESSQRSDSSREQSGSRDQRRDDYRKSDQRHGDNRRDSGRSYGHHHSDSRHDDRDKYDHRDRHHGHDNRNWQGSGGYNRDNRYGGSGNYQNRRDDRYGNNQRGGYRNDNYRGGYNNRGRGGSQGGGYGGYHGGGGYY